MSRHLEPSRRCSLATTCGYESGVHAEKGHADMQLVRAYIRTGATSLHKQLASALSSLLVERYDQS